MEQITSELLRSGGMRIFKVVGGRGMGKTSALQGLEATLTLSDEHVVVRVADPPAIRTAPAALEQLRAALGVTGNAPGFATGETVGVIARWMDQHDSARLFLLYDEVDAWFDPEAVRPWARDFFNTLKSAHERYPERLAIVLAGGIGLQMLGGSSWGSPLVSRATPKLLAPFSDEELAKIVLPFEEKGAPLSLDERQTLAALTGGHPVLVTAGLQRLWGATERGPAQLGRMLSDFVDQMDEFVGAVRRSVAFDLPDGAIAHLFAHLRDHRGQPHRPADLNQVLKGASGADRLSLRQALELLQAAGLARINGNQRADPLDISIIPSLLTLHPELLPQVNARPSAPSLREWLVAELELVSDAVHRMSLDWYDGGDKLVRESVFSAVVAISLHCRGWEADRETQEGPGFVDLKLRHSHFPSEAAIVEVKGWWNRDRAGAHEQVLSYPGRQITARVVLMLASEADRPAIQRYRVDYLGRHEVEDRTDRVRAPQLTGHFVASHAGESLVHHLLIVLPRRKRQRSQNGES